jgi:iron-sulfur cluster repair protein YtfE (RIC family)
VALALLALLKGTIAKGGLCRMKIATFMEEDHDHLDRLFATYQTGKALNREHAVQTFAQFKQLLQRHIVWEEDILFPIFEQRTGMKEVGPTAVMRVEHKSIKCCLDRIHEDIRAGGVGDDQVERLLLDLLVDHNKKEETVLYPWLDRTLSSHEAETAIEQMRQLPEDRYHHCCGTTGTA